MLTSKWILGLCVGFAIAVPMVPVDAAEPTLAAVQKRGHLLCGVNANLPVYSFLWHHFPPLRFPRSHLMATILCARVGACLGTPARRCCNGWRASRSRRGTSSGLGFAKRACDETYT